MSWVPAATPIFSPFWMPLPLSTGLSLLTWEAFKDYIMDSISLTRLDSQVIQRIAATGKSPVTVDEFLALGDPSWQGLQRCRERDECLEKLQFLGLVEKK